jgi:hypothetical protein
MYNPNRKIKFLLVSSISTILAKIQGENKEKTKKTKNKYKYKNKTKPKEDIFLGQA